MRRVGTVERLRPTPRSTKLVTAIAAGLLIVSSFAVAAHAGPAKKQFAAGVLPGILNGSLVNNQGFATFTALVQNQNQSQQVGSAQFTVPSGSGFSIADHSTTG
ncbi:MAG TPA: hypothetical protein VJ818_03430, partial [Actinomycetota bacterium]|nr:hypothetical protein [Actinomycetota bacterium]